MDVNELAKALFGKDAKSNLLNSSPGATTTVYGTAMSNSENGEVQVFISDDAVGSDFGAEPDATIVTLPTSPAVKMGDTVAVTLLGGNTVKHPYVSAVIGSGDLTQSIANEAQRIAELTGQHFWADERGIHVTEVTEEEWKDEDSETYHSGMNMLSNSQGQLFRDAENILLAITAGDERGVSIFDGYGNSDENVISSYTKSGMTIGKATTNQIQADAYGFKVINPVYGDVFDVGHTASSIEHKQLNMTQTVRATPSEAGVWTKTFAFTDEVLATNNDIRITSGLSYMTGEVVGDEELAESIGIFAPFGSSAPRFSPGTAETWSFRNGSGGSPVIAGRLNADIVYDGDKTFTFTIYDDRISTDTEYFADGYISYATANITLPVVTIGPTNETHVVIDNRSLQLLDEAQDEFFFAGDLRDVNGLLTVVERFLGNGTEHTFNLSYPAESIVKVTVNGVSAGYNFTSGNNYIYIRDAPAANAAVEITYKTADASAKAFTFGTRDEDYTIGGFSSSFGQNNVASGFYSYAEGENAHALGKWSHAEGSDTVAGSYNSHAEGGDTSATGESAHAEGRYSTSAGYAGHAEGYRSATGDINPSAYGSHAEGYSTHANGNGSHAEGRDTYANYDYSHAEGLGNVAGMVAQHVQGKYAVYDRSNAFIIGNGTDDSNRSNALTMDWSGNIEAAGTATSRMRVNKATNIDIATTPSSDTWGNAELRFDDQAGERLGFVNVERMSNGRSRITMAAYADNAGTAVSNNISLYVLPDGTRTYSVSSPTNFRSAIGLGTDIEWTHLAGPAESSLPSGTSDRNGVWYRRKHNMVEVQLVSGGTWSNGKTWNTSAQTIATLPSGCRPGIPIHDTGNVPGGNTVGQVIVSTDGTIQIQLGTGSSKYFRAHFMFTV